MDFKEQKKIQTVSASNTSPTHVKCSDYQVSTLNNNDENNNLRKTNSNKNQSSINPISEVLMGTCHGCEPPTVSEEKESSNSSTVKSEQNTEKESEPGITLLETSSDEDECWCSSCSLAIDDEKDLKYRKLWDHLSHVIRCLYRATDRDFSEIHLSNDISKVKRYVKKLTQVNPRSLFNRLESIVLDYVKEICKQVLHRFQNCLKTSHDVQLFIAFLLDEYQMFIQAATHVSTVISYLEENYMKKFGLTWLLYNKHLFEEWIYMDRKIHHSMTIMIDLLQPANEDEDENNNSDRYSPAQYTELLNRFLAFDKEMVESASLYRDCETKMNSKSPNEFIQNDCQLLKNMALNKKRPCKKLFRYNMSTTTNNGTMNSFATTAAVNIPSPKNPSSTFGVVSTEQDSRCSSVESGTAGDEFSSTSSLDDNLLDNETSSSGYTQEEQEELTRLILNDDDMNEYLIQEILNSVAPYGQFQHPRSKTKLNEKLNNNDTGSIELDDDWIQSMFYGDVLRPPLTESRRKVDENPTDNVSPSVKHSDKSITISESTSTKSSLVKSKPAKSSSSSRRRKEKLISMNSTAIPTIAVATSNMATTKAQLPKKSIAAELLLPSSFTDLTARIQSVSFTPGTFGSIAPTNTNDYIQIPTVSSTPESNSSKTTAAAAKTTTNAGQTRLSINLTRKPGFKSNDQEGQKLAQALLNEFTGLSNGESLGRESTTTARKKDSQQFKKSKQQRTCITSGTIPLDEMTNSLITPNHYPNLFAPSSKPDSNSLSSAYNNLDQLLRHAASNPDVSEAALQSILSSFHSSTSFDSMNTSSKTCISSKTAETLQALINQQQHHPHRHHQHSKKSHLTTRKRCEYCCCECSLEGQKDSPSTCHHPPCALPATNEVINGCSTCMTVPGTNTATTSVLGPAIAGFFNHRDVEMKERLKLKLTKRTVQSLSEQQNAPVEQVTDSKQQLKKIPSPVIKTTDKKTSKENSSKTKSIILDDKNNIDDLVRFIDGDQSISSNTNEHQTTNNESTSKKSKRKKDKHSRTLQKQQENGNDTSQTKIQHPNKIDKHEKAQDSHATQELTSVSKVNVDDSKRSLSKATPSVSLPICTEEPEKSVSKRKQKAKMKRQQHEQGKQKNVSEPVQATATVIDVNPNLKPSVVTTPVLVATVPSTSSEKKTTVALPSDIPSDTFDSGGEEVNWITISRKQSKHKQAPSSVPSLLATPILPVVPTTTSTSSNTTATATIKQQRSIHSTQQSTVQTKKMPSAGNASPTMHSKLVVPNSTAVNLTTNSCTMPNSTHKQPPSVTPVPIARIQTMQNHPITNAATNTEASSPSSSLTQPSITLWRSDPTQDLNTVFTTTVSPVGFISSNSLPTNSSFTPNHSSSTVTIQNSASVIGISSKAIASIAIPDHLGSCVSWDTGDHHLSSVSSTIQSSIIPSATPGPVQRPHVSFSLAPGTSNHSTSRCIQRPSSDTRTFVNNVSSFIPQQPFHYGANSTANPVRKDTAVTSKQQNPWDLSQENSTKVTLSNPLNDFPLYDPFRSGAVLTISSCSNQNPILINGFTEHFGDQSAMTQDNDFNDMDALDKEIEDFKNSFRQYSVGQP